MAKLFNQGVTLTPRQNYERKYKSAVNYLLILVVVTAINLLLVGFGSDRYYLFSAYIPYLLVVVGMSWCGMLPPEYYEYPMEDYIFYDKSLFVALLMFAIILTSLYLLAWFMTKKNRGGWMIFSLVFFGIDTAAMLIIEGFAFTAALNIVCHAVIIYALVMGIIAHNKLKYMPEEAPVTEFEAVAAEATEPAEVPEAATEPAQNSPVLRIADKDVKHRVLLQKRVFNMDICYRRVKRVNELVINGNVYDEYEALVEFGHVLSAHVNGHYIEVGYDNGLKSFIKVDGQIVASKVRIV